MAAGRTEIPPIHPRFLALGIVLLAALLSFRSIDDLDYGIHVATGRWMLANGTVPTTDPFSWSFSSHAYIAYHWGFQVLVAALDDSMGLIGPVLLRSLLVVATAAAVVGSCRTRHVDPLIGAVCGLLAVIAAEWRFSIRPELFSNLFIACTVLVLDRRRAGHSRAIWLLPLVFLGWVNTHIYILGLVVVGFELAESLFAKRLDRAFLLAALLSLAALFINPYGWDAVKEPIRLFTRMDSSNAFAQHISELSSPFSLPSDPKSPFNLHAQLGSWIVLLVLAIPAAWGLLRQRRLADLLVLGSFALLSTLAIRNLPLFVIAALPALVTGLSEALPRLVLSFNTHRQKVAIATAAVLLVVTIRVASGAWYASQRRDIHLAPILERAKLAIDAADFVRSHALVGRGFNNLDVGGALLLRASNHKIFIDGRNEVTGEAFFRRYLSLLEPAAFGAFAAQEHVEYAVIGHQQNTKLISSLLETGAWTMAHYDAVAVVLVRKGGPNGSLAPQALPAPLADDAERWKYLTEIYIKPSMIERLSRWLFGGEEMAEAQSRTGTFLLMLGQWPQAERPLLEAAIRAPDFWETSNNLGALYTRLKAWEAAAFAYRSVLMLNPGYPLAQQRFRESWIHFQQARRATS